MNRMLHASVSLYKALLVLYPPEVRNRFGSEMAETFAQQLTDAWAEERASGVLKVWALALPELFWIALAGQVLRPAIALPVTAILITGPLFLSLIWALQHPLVLNAWYHQLLGGGRH